MVVVYQNIAHTHIRTHTIYNHNLNQNKQTNHLPILPANPFPPSPLSLLSLSVSVSLVSLGLTSPR